MLNKKNKIMNTTTIIISIITLIIGIIIGKVYPLDMTVIEELEKHTESLEPMNDDQMIELLESSNAAHDMQLVGEFNSYIKLLEHLEKKDLLNLEKIIVHELGNNYYNYTYEDERYMNSDSVNECLKTIENKANKSELFKKVFEYKPE